MLSQCVKGLKLFQQDGWKTFIVYYKIIANPKICKPHTKIYQDYHGDFFPILKETKLGLRIIQLNTFNCGEGHHPSIEGRSWTNFHENLVGGFNPLDTYYIVSQIGSFPDIRAKIKDIGWKHLETTT